MIPNLFILAFHQSFRLISNTFAFFIVFILNVASHKISTNFPHFFLCLKCGLEFFLFLVFDIFCWIFSPFFFFADELKANDKFSRSNSSELIRNNSMHHTHSHISNLIQSTSSSITNLMASSETIASNAENCRSKYEKPSRKKRHKRRRK